MLTSSMTNDGAEDTGSDRCGDLVPTSNESKLIDELACDSGAGNGCSGRRSLTIPNGIRCATALVFVVVSGELADCRTVVVLVRLSAKCSRRQLRTSWSSDVAVALPLLLLPMTGDVEHSTPTPTGRRPSIEAKYVLTSAAHSLNPATYLDICSSTSHEPPTESSKSKSALTAEDVAEADARFKLF